jgi:uncharacterized phage protein (TIGR02220 family)
MYWMAKIRTIKVEFWTSEQIVSCSITARLLFIGIWNFCDDNGNHPASYSRLKMQIFPADTISLSDIKELVSELLREGLLVEYQVESNSYWHVTGWKHQTIARKFTKFPDVNDEKAVLKQCSSSVQAVSEQCSSIAVNGNGNGNGNNIMSSCAQTTQPVDNSGAAHLDVTPSSLNKSCARSKGINSNVQLLSHLLHDVTPSSLDKSCPNPKELNSKELRDAARRLITFLNQKANRKFRFAPKNLKPIMNRLRSGATEVQCRQIILRKCAQWCLDDKMHFYLRPETLFNATKFESYIGELVLPKEEEK